MSNRLFVGICAFVLGLAMPTLADAEEDWRYELGLRANVLLGNGKPANDILGLGVVGRYRLENGWFIGAAIDSFQYDFERPAKVVRIAQDPAPGVIDADGEFTSISGLIGRLYGETDRRFDWFWTLGVVFASPSVDDVSGPTDTGGTFDITFDVGDEIHLMGALGASYNFSSRWSASLTARLGHQFIDIVITDRVSGNSAKIDSQTVMGASLSLNYRF